MFITNSVQNTYLLEVGTEELPSGFMETLPAVFQQNWKTLADEAGIPFSGTRMALTPRRIALFVEGLSETQPDQEVLHKGPPVRIAFDAKGQPTPAAEAFAKKVGVTVDALSRETLGKDECLTYRETVSGQSVQSVIQALVPELIFSVSGPRFMQWGLAHEGKLLRFPRPIRWLLSLWNDEHLPIAFGEMQSDRITYGHRYLSEGPIPVTSATSYLSQLEAEGKVIADPDRRRQKLVDPMNQQAAQLSASLLGMLETDDLIQEVNNLVEYPTVVQDVIDAKFLSLPKPVITTTMMHHQKYFPLEHRETGALMPQYLIVSNGPAGAEKNIIAGNQRVLRARLEDAKFFFEEDTKRPLKARLEELNGITFQKGLGTMADKTRRLVELAGYLAKALNYSEAEQAQCRQAAELSKCDLATQMVYEYTELQGVIGQEYAQKEGLPEPVCDALFEQYLPRHAREKLPETRIGKVLSIVDKLDNIVAVFSQKDSKMPTGSKDPMGLRRSANGLIRIITDNQFEISLNEIVAKNYEWIKEHSQNEILSLEAMCQKIEEFLMLRYKSLLMEGFNWEHRIADELIPLDVIHSVFALEDSFDNLTKTAFRAMKLKGYRQNHQGFPGVYESACRISKILGQNYQATVQQSDVKPELFEQPEEGLLWEAIRRECILEYTGNIATLEFALPKVTDAIKAYFEAVMVNAEDPAVRQNRYAMLSLLNKAYLSFGVFTELLPPEAPQTATIG